MKLMTSALLGTATALVAVASAQAATKSTKKLTPSAIRAPGATATSGFTG